MTLNMLEYLQERLLEGDEGVYDSRSPNTVNSMMGAVMAFVRFCHKHEWIERVPSVERLEVNDVMKGRPVTQEEFERMLEATPRGGRYCACGFVAVFVEGSLAQRLSSR